ncbi:hypothetical protein ACHHYP_20166 [Achlya hypogyna]|uniref:RING-type domain-containing protein n=1 Tax=Achlya hypogyna TaxID=1202772 RepID=A0A1V9Z1S1_ACHHY|nr:hypothetical protein ACHHYP_20166 [Achlya hypogyna]
MEKAVRKYDKLYSKVLDHSGRRDKARFKQEAYASDAAKVAHWRLKEAAADAKMQKAHLKLAKSFTPAVIPTAELLWYAAKYGLVEVLRRGLAIEDMEADLPDAKTHHPPFMMACVQGHIECARALYDARVNVMAVNLAGFSALHCASQHGQFAIVQWLLTLPEVDPFAKSFNTLTALEVARKACALGDKFGKVLKCVRLLEQHVLVFSGWIYESLPDSIANKYILNTVGLNCHTWRLRYALVLSTGPNSNTLEFVLYDQRENGHRPAAPESYWLYEKGDSLTMPGTKRTLNNRDHTFSFNAIQKADLGEAGVFARVECAATDGPGLQKWVAFFEECFVEASVHTAERSTSARSVEPATPQPAAPRRHSSSASSTMARTPSYELFPTRAPPQYNELFPSAPPPAPTKMLAVDALEVVPDRRFAATAPSFCEEAPPTRQFQAMQVSSAPPLLPPQSRECVVCFDGPQVGVCVPCGHNAVCMACADRIMEADSKTCPVCRAEVLQIIRLYQC